MNPPQTIHPRQWVVTPALLILYLLTVGSGIFLVTPPERLSIFWMASGVALAVLLIHPRGLWLIWLALFFTVNLVANLHGDVELSVSVGFAAANTLGPWCCAWFMQRIAGPEISFYRQKDVVLLAITIFGVNAALSTLGALVPVLAYGSDFVNTFVTWWVLDGAGMAILTPALVTWAGQERISRGLVSVSRSETIFWAACLCLATWFIFGTVDLVYIYIDPRPYMLFPLLLLTSLRLSPRSITVTLVVMLILALAATFWERGANTLGGDTMRERMVAVQAFFLVAGQSALLLAASYTDRKLTERALRQSEARFRALVEYGSDAVTLIDSAGKIRYDDPTVRRLTGYTPEERLGADVLAFIHPDDLSVTKAIFASVQFIPGDSRLFYFRSIHKDGHTWWVEATLANLLDNPDIGALVLNFHDVSERKQAEADRERLLLELQSKNRELESLLYVASHDLRSPLVNIQGFGQNIQRYLARLSESLAAAPSLEAYRAESASLMTERIPRAIGFVMTSSAKMDRLIDGLLRLSRLGRIQPQMARVDMDELFKVILDSMTFQKEKSGAQVEIQHPLPACYGDFTLLGQVFSNLLDNAIKYRHPNRPLLVQVSGFIRDGWAVYEVKDNGVGIAPEQQEQIWGVFRRLADDTIPGEGLGLTIVRRIAEKHGARTRVESRLDEGSRFIVELPVRS